MKIALRSASILPSPPDIYRQTALELLRLLELYQHGPGKKHLHSASNACGAGKASTFHLAMFMFRAHCRDLIALSHKIEREFDEAQADEIDDCKTVYAP